MSLTSAERWAELEHRNAQAFADGFDGAEVNVCLDELRDLIAAARERDTLRELLMEYVDWHGGLHVGDCPEDDTCDCPLVARTNAALAAIKGESHGDS